LRNAQSARYARWAATTAALIALLVGGVYVHRAIRAARARHDAPPVVPATVERQTDEFTYTGTNQAHTPFTIRASHATEYKDQNRMLLQDVWVTFYGREGDRNDTIHTRECSYSPKSGDVHCDGEVQIDFQKAASASGKQEEVALEVKTRNLSYNRDTGEASTNEPVAFTFPQGTGHGVGIRYSSNDAIVRVQHAVEFDLTPSERTSGLPVTATGSSLEIRRNDRVVVLEGPAVVRQGGRELSAEKISVDLDQEFHARHATAEGHPAIHSVEASGKTDVTAEKFEASLNPQGWIEQIVGDGKVAGSRETPRGTDNFSAAHVEFAMEPQHNALKEMTASGGVTAHSQEGENSRVLKTDALRVVFSPAQNARDGPDKQRIESAETLAPATIESKSADGTTDLRARKFNAAFGPDGRLAKLTGHSGVEVRSQMGKQAPQVTSAAELVATFGVKGGGKASGSSSPNAADKAGGQGDWETLEETGDVRFQQADRHASAAHARIDRATDTITMDGSPILSDALSRSTVGNVKINQKSGEMQAGGGVVSTYLPTGKGDAVNLGTGPAHVTAESLSGSTTSGHVVYTGHARLWQGDSVMDADQIGIWRDQKKMQAEGHVVAVFTQASGATGFPAMGPQVKSSSLTTANSVGKASAAPSGPTLWVIHAPLLTYWNDEGKAHLEGGVTASSQQGSLDSRSLDVFLSQVPAGSVAIDPGHASSVGNPGSLGGGGTGGPSGASGSRQLSRALALGAVVVRQGDRRGTAERADYTAADGKFVLSGGKPTLVDASGDATTGHSLTFYVASDTILIDSETGSRTLSKHRVEK
jgi:lipopolysaccharide export system protein LptA